MKRNAANQSIELFAYDNGTGAPKTGDAANLTTYLSKDDGTLTALADSSATEISSTNAPGVYRWSLSQAETNAYKLLITGKSSTSLVTVVPRIVFTEPASDVTAAERGVFASLAVPVVVTITGVSGAASAFGMSLSLSATDVTNANYLASYAYSSGDNLASLRVQSASAILHFEWSGGSATYTLDMSGEPADSVIDAFVQLPTASTGWTLSGGGVGTPPTWTGMTTGKGVTTNNPVIEQ